MRAIAAHIAFEANGKTNRVQSAVTNGIFFLNHTSVPEIDRFLICNTQYTMAQLCVGLCGPIEFRMMAICEVFQALSRFNARVVLMKSNNSNNLKQCQKLAHDPEVAFIHSVICTLLWLAALIKALIHIIYNTTHSMANFHFDINIDIDTHSHTRAHTRSHVSIIRKQSNNGYNTADFAS